MLRIMEKNVCEKKNLFKTITKKLWALKNKTYQEK